MPARELPGWSMTPCGPSGRGGDDAMNVLATTARRLAVSVGLLLAGLARGDQPEPIPASGGLRRLPVAEAPAGYRARWAVVVGIDDYSRGQGFAQLGNAANDAREFRRLLVEEFGYDRAHVLYLSDATD